LVGMSAVGRAGRCRTNRLQRTAGFRFQCIHTSFTGGR
jgi:hypothetical protein